MNATTRWTLPADLVPASVEVMRPNGRRGHEGLGLWFGRRDGGHVAITHLVELSGPGFLSAPLQLRLSWRAMSHLTDLADELGLYMAGQIHSHPGTMVDLSPVDKEFGVRCQDYLSAVCPHYAQRDTRELRSCGVHIFEGGHYRRLSDREVNRRISLSPTPAVRLHVEVAA